MSPFQGDIELYIRSESAVTHEIIPARKSIRDSKRRNAFLHFFRYRRTLQRDRRISWVIWISCHNCIYSTFIRGSMDRNREASYTRTDHQSKPLASHFSRKISL